jgi:hypothetical protein
VACLSADQLAAEEAAQKRIVIWFRRSVFSGPLAADSTAGWLRPEEASVSDSPKVFLQLPHA